MTVSDCIFGACFTPEGALRPSIYVFFNSPTIAAGIVNVKRYLHVFNQAAKWFFTVEGHWGYIRFLLMEFL